MRRPVADPIPRCQDRGSASRVTAVTNPTSTPTQSLQHSEALARFDLLTVDGYDVRLDLAGSDETFRSVTTVRFQSQGGPTFIDLKPVSVREIRFNGAPVDVDTLERGRLPLDTV